MRKDSWAPNFSQYEVEVDRTSVTLSDGKDSPIHMVRGAGTKLVHNQPTLKEETSLESCSGYLTIITLLFRDPQSSTSETFLRTTAWRMWILLLKMRLRRTQWQYHLSSKPEVAQFRRTSSVTKQTPETRQSCWSRWEISRNHNDDKTWRGFIRATDSDGNSWWWSDCNRP